MNTAAVTRRLPHHLPSFRIEAAKRAADDEYKAVSTALATSKQLAAARPTTPLDSLYGEEGKSLGLSPV